MILSIEPQPLLPHYRRIGHIQLWTKYHARPLIGKCDQDEVKTRSKHLKTLSKNQTCLILKTRLRRPRNTLPRSWGARTPRRLAWVSSEFQASFLGVRATLEERLKVIVLYCMFVRSHLQTIIGTKENKKIIVTWVISKKNLEAHTGVIAYPVEQYCSFRLDQYKALSMKKT